MPTTKDYDEGRLLAALPVYADKISVYSPTLKQIFSIGETIYNIYLSVCINELQPNYTLLKNKFDNVLNYSGEILYLFLQGLYVFTNLKFMPKQGCFVADDGKFTLCHDNYDMFVQMVKLANCIGIDDAKKEDGDVRNKELDRKIAEAKAKVNKRLGRKSEEEKIRLVDLVSVLASQHKNLNIMNVWELSYYQFNDQFKRMQLIENYNIGVRQLLAGVDRKHVNLEHYIRKIN